MKLLVFLITLLPILANGQKMQKAEEPEEVGLVEVSDSLGPLPSGIEWLAIDATKFSAGLPLVNVDGLEGAEPYVFSVAVRSNATALGRVSCETEEVYYGRHTPVRLPATDGEWKQVRCFFRSSPGSTSAMIRFTPPKGEGVNFEVKEPRFRRATEDEFTAAWKAWRSQYPLRDLSARPTDGVNLGNFVSKLQNPPVGVDELLVMGIGSSYTNMLGNGERLVQWVREHYPNAPKIVYKKHVGSAVAFDYTRGWMRQYVLGEQPGLVILYSEGTGEDLEKLLKDFRSHSAADVIVASLHLRERAVEISEATIHQQQWKDVRAVAEKYGCEWVDNRVEWADYLIANDKPIQWLIKDAVHQNDHGALVINENLMRHIVPNEGAVKRPLETFISGANKVNCTGYRIDLVGKRSPDGGKAKVTINGKPADQFPAFVTTLIKPAAKNHKPARGSAADRSPHMVRLGALDRIVPQEWKIVMTSDTGDYELIGSITGSDGRGNNGADFTSDSGQIIVPTDLWRRRIDADGTHTNRTGDVFSWEVKRSILEEVDFAGADGEVFSVTLGTQLPHGDKTFEVEEGKGEILGYRIFSPSVPSL